MPLTTPGELQKRLRGVQIIMVTPFDERGSVCIDRIRQLTRYLIDQGIREGRGVLVTQGSMSECFSVDTEERTKIVKAVVGEAGRQVPVVVGCNATDTRTVIRLCQNAQKAGADGVMVMPPYYFAPSNEEILQFYRSVTQSIDVGVVLYNNVQVCIDIELEVLRELASLDKIVALKDCTADFTKFKICAAALADQVTILNGGGPLWEPQATIAGSRGFYTLAGNFAPELALQLWQACEQGDYRRAENLSRQFLLYIRFMREARKSIQLTKEIMRDLGLPGGYERPPLLPLTAAEKNVVQEVKSQMGLRR